jgi:hypothetical protein
VYKNVIIVKIISIRSHIWKMHFDLYPLFNTNFAAVIKKKQIMTEIKISLFKGYSDMQPTENTLQEVVNLIKNDALVRDRTEKHRYYTAQKQKAAAAQEKSSCPCFAVAVRFEGGKRKENICGWTRLGLADIDHVPDDRLQELLKIIDDKINHPINESNKKIIIFHMS